MFFVRLDDELLPIVAMRVSNPDRLSVSLGFQKRRQRFVGI
jgi:hypothetical protein